MRQRDVVEVVTTLGDSIVARAIVDREAAVGDDRIVEIGGGFALRRRDGVELALARGASVCVPFGLGSIIATVTPRATRKLPHTPTDRRTIGFLVASLAAHLAMLAIASRQPVVEPPPQTQGSPRPRLVANRSSEPLARPDSQVVASAHAIDERAHVPPPNPPVSRTRAAALPKPVAAPVAVAERDTQAARHFDPCATGDCGLIASGRYSTHVDGRRSGDSYQLPPREPRTLAISVVTCSLDGGCNTVVGADQNEIRAEIAHHVADLDACFARDATSTSASIDLRVEAHGHVRVAAHDETAVANCIAAVVGKLDLPAGDRDVPLAFARDR